MRFLTDADCEPWFAKLGFDRDGLVPGTRGAERFKISEVMYGDPFPIAERVGRSIAAHQGNFAECLLWCEGVVFGDLTREPDPPRAWRDYYRWRRQMGETRILYDAPGHLFVPSERDALAQVVAWAMCMRWEAFIAAKPNKFVLSLCHDDYLTLYARSTPGGLLDDLRRLGLEPKRPAPQRWARR
jgi:hypothetical protein